VILELTGILLLLSFRLLSYIYGQVAVMEAMSGYFSYFATMAWQGFMPWTLIGLRRQWENSIINDLEDSWGQEWVCLT
jgi:sodium/potassium-transporting ATPase subunit alpha